MTIDEAHAAYQRAVEAGCVHPATIQPAVCVPSKDAEKEFARDPGLQAKFPNAKIYESYLRAVEQGFVNPSALHPRKNLSVTTFKPTNL